MKRAIALGDVWHPNVTPLPTFRNLITQFRNLPGGKDKPISVRIPVNIKTKDSIFVGPQGDKRLILSGNMSENKDTLSELQKLGVSTVLVTPSPSGTTTLADQVENLRAISENFIRKSEYIA